MSARGRSRSTTKAGKLLDEPARAALAGLAPSLRATADWSEAALEALCRERAEAAGIGFGKLAQPLRVALTGGTVSPGVFEIMRVLGRDEVVGTDRGRGDRTQSAIAAGRLSDRAGLLVFARPHRVG